MPTTEVYENQAIIINEIKLDITDTEWNAKHGTEK